MKRIARITLAILGSLLLILLVSPFLVPVRPLENTRPPKELADPDSQFIQVGELDMHVKTAGSGQPTLVLLHGFGASLFSWQQVTLALAENHTVIAFDRPAFGLTERPMPGEWQGASPYSTAAQATQTIGLMDALGIEKAILVGNSAGGTVSILTALTYPERVSGLVLVSPAVYSGAPFPAWVSPLLRSPQMRRIGPLLARSITQWGEETIYEAWHDPTKVTAETLSGYKKPLQSENWDRALWELTAGREALDLPAQLGRLRVPTLLITGDDDRIVPTAESLRLATELPAAELVVLPGCGHVPQEECPQAFLDAVQSWLPASENEE